MRTLRWPFSQAGSKALGDAAFSALQAAQSDPDHPPLLQMISSRRDFPDAWHHFARPTNPDATAQVLTLDLSAERFQYRFSNPALGISMVGFFLIFKEPDQSTKDYASGARLRFTITPDDGAPWAPTELISQPALLNGTPRQVVELAAPLSLPSAWDITLQEQDVKLLAPALVEVVPPTPAGHARLRADLIDDLVIVLHCALG